MNSNVLADLVLEVIKTGSTRELSEEENLRFHSEFEAEISNKVEEMRAAKRRAYEELKNIAVR